MSSLKHDPQEDDSASRAIIEDAAREADENLAHLPRVRGFCHRLWAEQKRILREQHGIEWRSPADMNPMVLFD